MHTVLSLVNHVTSLTRVTSVTWPLSSSETQTIISHPPAPILCLLSTLQVYCKVDYQLFPTFDDNTVLLINSPLAPDDSHVINTGLVTVCQLFEAHLWLSVHWVFTLGLNLGFSFYKSKLGFVVVTLFGYLVKSLCKILQTSFMFIFRQE